MVKSPTRSTKTSSHLPSQRVVAFIDILGFRSLVSQMREDHELFALVRDALSSAKAEALRKPPVDEASLQQAHFSDSVVYSAEMDPSSPERAVRTIVYRTAFFSGGLLRAGVLTRGGIAMGWMFHKGNVLFGDGLVAAYDLETRVSHFPRIVLADDVAACLSGELEGYTLPLCRDSDGFYYIDTIGMLGGVTTEDQGVRRWHYYPVTGRHSSAYQKLRDRLQAWLSTTRAPDLLAKYRWLAVQFNAALRRHEVDDEVKDIDLEIKDFSADL
jgi:hypothetical protein